MPAQLSRRLLLTSGLALCSGACTQLQFLAANIPASFGEYSRKRDVRYGAQTRNSLDIYLPVKPVGAPVVVYFHGGGWNSGDKSEYKFVGAALAEQGYVAVLPNYRLYPQVKFPAFMQDAALAVAWVHARVSEWGADSQRVYLMGHSAGAHIAVLLGLNPAYLNAVNLDTRFLRGVIGLAGPYDFLPFKYKYMFDLFGPAARFPLSQPINFVRADAPPMLLLHGMQDTTVAPYNTQHLVSSLTAVGVPVTANYYAKANHGDLVAAFSIPARRRVPVLAAVSEFIGASVTPRPD
jgi:acetyl esterase/lipase